MIDLKSLLRDAIALRASDLHIKAGAAPHIRIHGDLVPVDGAAVITKEETLDLAQQMLNTRQKEILARKSELDLAFGGPNLGRFRVAVFQQRSSLSMVFRVIPETAPSIETLNLPRVLKTIASESRGLVLVTGTTGSGKSTTLAAMIEHINETRPCHIMTIEDPIEFSFRDRRAFITQREISVDTDTFSTALRAALRQDPDVIMVGEMRDLETVSIALQAAETGHLVLSTLHTTDALGTINRIISIFPVQDQREIRLQLASVLTAVLSMRLIPSPHCGRVPAVEVLRNTEFVSSLIHQSDKTPEIRKALEAGVSQYGMQSFDQSILFLYQGGLITLQDALANATSPEDLKLRMQGIVTSTEIV